MVLPIRSWSIEQLNQREAQYSIVNTLLLIIVILIMYVLLSMDVTAMVVQPIESMVGLVRRLAALTAAYAVNKRVCP